MPVVPSPQMPDWNWITNRIAIGSEPSAADVRVMRQQGITDVLDLRGEPTANGPAERPEPQLYMGSGIAYHYVPMRDRGAPAPGSADDLAFRRAYEHGVSVIQYAMSDPSRRILVHCAAGENRSPSMVYAYLRSAGMSPTDAQDMIVAHRTVATNQYTATAERAVPYLPKPPPPVLVRRITAGVVVAAGVAAVLYALYPDEIRKALST